MSVASSLKTAPYRLSYCLVGVWSIVTQIILIREFLVILFGNELFMGAIFAVWLTAIFSGALLGGKTVAKVINPLPVYLYFLYSLSALPFLQIILIRHLRTILQVFPGEMIGFGVTVAVLTIVLFPFAFLVGLLFPFAAAGFPQSSRRPSRSIGLVYIWESVGSMIGGAALTYFLIGRLSPIQILALGSALLILVSFFLSVQANTSRRRFVSALGLVTALLWIAITCFDGWNGLERNTIQQRWKSINPFIPLLENIDTPYQNLVVGKLEDQFSIYGNGQHILSFPDPVQSAVTAHFLLTQHPEPHDVLLIGGGVEGLLAEILKHSVETVHYVELDPTLVSLARERLALSDKSALYDPRVTFFACDGRYFVKQAPSRYDLIIVNTPDPSTAMLNRYYTVDFYNETADILQPGGLLVTSISSAVNYIAPEVARYVGSIYHSLANVFSHVLIVPGDSNYFFAGNDPFNATLDSAILAKRFADRNIDTEFFTQHHFALLLPPDRIDFITHAITRSPPRFVNTDNRPVSYFYNLTVWEQHSGAGVGAVLERLTTIGSHWYFFFVALFLLSGCIYLSFSPSGKPYQRIRFGTLTAIATTGFTGMGLEMVLLLSFQSRHGYLYHHLGIMVACFMAGLAAGAVIMNRFPRRSVNQALTTLLLLEILVGSFSFLLPRLIEYGSSAQGNTAFLIPGEWSGLLRAGSFLILICTLGILTGIEFPLATQLLINSGGPAGRVAGMVDGFDHGGAALGAALTGTLLVPLYGISFSASFIAALNAVSVIFLGIVLVRGKRKVRGSG